MTYQSEASLEAEVIQLLTTLGYKYTKITNEEDLLSNLKTQLEALNQTSFTDSEFIQIQRYLGKGTIFEKANKLREYIDIKSEDDKPTKYIKLLNQEDYTKNSFQITQQVTIQGKYQNRYDITLLINGLPLVQIELKRRGLELKEAFNQINRYQRDSYGASAGLFHYIQIFIISNGVNTKYFANNKDQSFKQTFYWTDDKNNKISDIKEFSNTFLKIDHIHKMISKYIVLNTDDKLMILRPYQIYAVEAIINHLQTSRENGYIWHTTGSGKTLTSFKTSQILVKHSEIDKVIFVVDRKDLDSQTRIEFEAFSAGCVSETKNTKYLVDQLLERTIGGGAMKDKLVITTIQKLNNAFSKYESQLEVIKNQRIIFIFDECHRSQFGQTHKRIVNFFKPTSNIQMIGFTGTPIFEENAMSNQGDKQTTADIFQKRLHQYVIVDAINDQNVLPFSIEYVGKYQIKDSATELDIEVNEDIDKKEVLESDARIEKIVDYVLKVNGQKTYNQEFSAIMALSSIDVLYKYYQVFKQKNKHLKICAVFSYLPNEEDPNANGILEGDTPDKLDQQAIVVGRDKLESIMADYNALYGTNFTTKDQHGFYDYFRDISKRLKKRDKKEAQNKDEYIDLLLVVNMFLTGFDSPHLNTIYVDKNLKYHGLIQAFSRTNRILNEKKSHGNVICFRNLKEATDKAISLFANHNAKDIILRKSYDEYKQSLNEIINNLLTTCSTPKVVDTLIGEDQHLNFITIFRDVLKMQNILSGFIDFKWSDLQIQEQDFEDFKSKYLDLYERYKKKSTAPITHILKDIDFMMELVHRDEVNVSYILKLIDSYFSKQIHDAKERQHILNLLNNEPKLRNKKDLIEAFLEELNLTQGNQGLVIDDIQEAFILFSKRQRVDAFNKMCSIQNLDKDKTMKIVEQFLYDGIPPSMDDLEDAYLGIIDIDEYSLLIENLNNQILQFISTYHDLSNDLVI
jgi:type I restriction enzyme R subunit